MRGTEPFGDEKRVWGRNLYTPNFHPSIENDSLISNFHIGNYLFHHFAYHETGVLSVQTRDKPSKRPTWKVIEKLANQTSSLKRFLQPYYPVFQHYLVLNDKNYTKNIQFVVCEHQKSEDAIEDLLIRYNFNDRDGVMDGLCALIEEDKSLSPSYKCSRGHRKTHKIIGNINVIFNEYVSLPVYIREGYSPSFYAKCACTFTNYCSEKMYENILLASTSVISKVQTFPILPVFSFPTWLPNGTAYMFPIYDFEVLVESQLMNLCYILNIEAFICDQIILHGNALYKSLLPQLRIPNILEAERNCKEINRCEFSSIPISIDEIPTEYPYFLVDKTFTKSIALDYFPAWKVLLKDKAHSKDLKILEIGSYEGLTSCWLLEYVCTDPSCTMITIDPHERGKNGGKIDDERSYAYFKNNTSAYGTS
jgi:hypothetical protein